MGPFTALTMKRKKSLSEYSILFYHISVSLRRLMRKITWYTDGKKYARARSNDNLPYRVKKHQSVLLRKLGQSDMQLQRNKVTNLKIAVKNLDGIIIAPGETFSFCKLVGKPTKRKGYLHGVELSRGKARPGIGGGICQISNLIFWMVLHSPLTVTERYHHSFDPFPDDGRVLPFGSGATVFYNYRDLQFTNNTAFTFQIRLWFSDKCLEGDLRVKEELPFTFHMIEKEHEFIEKNGQYFRKNEIWREKIHKINGTKDPAELMIKNYARVMYKPEVFITSK